MNPIKIETEVKIIPSSINWKCNNCNRIFFEEHLSAKCCICKRCKITVVNNNYCRSCECKNSIEQCEREIKYYQEEILRFQSIIKRIDYESNQK